MPMSSHLFYNIYEVKTLPGKYINSKRFNRASTELIKAFFMLLLMPVNNRRDRTKWSIPRVERQEVSTYLSARFEVLDHNPRVYLSDGEGPKTFVFILLIKPEKLKEPYLLILDSYGSYITKDFLFKYYNNNIFMLFLLVYSSYVF
ncbi:Uncharacterized protein HZ326_16383 [Fusarium oxysporum f. sp. albedinis]|nr:Uncharacterized protein HZ326_16383 [Fusarium oxysporum f. sp. albedinis]